MNRKVALVIATGLGAGYSPFAPGTMGSIVALPLFMMMRHLPPLIYVLICLLIFGVGIWATKKAQNHFGTPDPGHVVIDEIVGQLLTFFWLPVASSQMETLIVLISGFLLFRFFDILKPQPVKWADQQKTAFGVMLDDVFAGIYANLGVRVLLGVLPYISFS